MENIMMIQNEIDKSPLPCANCGKNMRYEKTGTAFIGFCFELRYDEQDPELNRFLQLQAGEFILGKTYSICFECFLKVLLFNN